MMPFKLTNEQRIKVLRDYGETCDRLVREKERQYITSIDLPPRLDTTLS